MGYLICSKCKGYYELQSSELTKDFVDECQCGGKLRYVENLDIVDPHWKPITLTKKKKKSEILSEKIKTFTKIPADIKNRLQQYIQKLTYRIDSARNQRRIHRNPQGMDMGNINSILAELNFRNIRWVLVIPFAVAIALILAYLPGIYTLLVLILLIALGYLFDNQIVGAKNALIAGGISFFFGSFLTGSFLLLIPYTLLGIVNGAVCGWIGGYLRSRIGINRFIR